MLRNAVIFAAALLLPLSAFAQVARGIVFGTDGLPAAGVEVRLGDEVVTSDADGSFVFDATSTPRALVVAGSSVQIVGEVEVLVNLSGDGVTFDVESQNVIEAEPEKPADDPVTAVTQITGQIVDEVGEPIPDVRVFVRGVKTDTRTDADGRFNVSVPAGEHTLAFVHPDFSSVDTQVLAAEGAEPVSVALTPSAMALDDYTVVAPRIEGSTADMLQERRESDSVTEVIGAEEMSKSGASDAADAMTRVTGITVVGGKYVYVRGLGDRYSATLLNGASLPSPEPERRVVPLDLFPTDLLESVVVQKTFSPEMPGEFGGGVVMLRTRGVPKTFEASIGVSTSVDTSSTFRDGLSSTSGSLDWLGFDDGTRRMPPALRDATDEAPLKEGDRFGSGGYTPEQLEEFGELIPNTWALNSRKNLPALGAKASLGTGFSLFGRDAGVRLGLTYDHDSDHEVREQNYYIVGSGGQLERSNSYRFETTTDNIVLGGILTAGLELPNDGNVTLTSVIDRVADAEDRVYQGHNRDVDTTIRVTRHRWLERQLLFEQLLGEHTIGEDLSLNWHYVFAQARRLEPDRRETRYDLRPGGSFQLSDRPEGNSRVYSTLVDNSHDVGAGVRFPFSLGNLTPELGFGAGAVAKDRTMDTRRFKYFGDSLDPQVLSRNPEDLFVAENIGQDGFKFLEVTRPTDNYSARQRIASGWVDTGWPLTESLELGAGARFEYSSQRVETFELFNPVATPVTAELETIDVLPVVDAQVHLSERSKLRFAGSRTVSRPDFRELSPMLFNDVTGGVAVQGNPELERALVTHADGRWEWYLSATESLSAGVFFKHFHRPIEAILVPGAQQLLTFANAKGATNLGLEAEARKSLGFVSPTLEPLYVATNASIIRSRIEIDPASGIQTSSERPLQGQSPWILNAQLGWDDIERGTSIALLFNVVGQRISEVGAQGAPDIYERAVPSLDFVARQKLGAFKLGFKAKNLLDPEVRYTQGENVVSAVRRGREFGLSLGLDY